MKKRTVLFVSFASLCLSNPSFALFCPNSFNQIEIGDTIQQVEQQCGKPDGIKLSKGDDNGPQEWNFYVQPTMNNYTSMRLKGSQEASVKMAIAMNDAKVINITVNGMSLATTTLCGGHSISVGNTAQTVKSACGDPAFINKSSASNNGEKPADITTYKYNSTPPTVLTFVNGKLQDRKN